MGIKQKAKLNKPTKHELIKRMRKLIQRIESLSVGVPEEKLKDMQLVTMLWSGLEWAKLGPNQPSDEQMSNMMIRISELNINMLVEYWQGVGRHV